MRLQLSNITNEACSSHRLDHLLLSKLLALMEHYVSMWQADNVKKSEREQEASSLYAFKQHGEVAESDEVLIDRLTKQSFPSFHQVWLSTPSSPYHIYVIRKSLHTTSCMHLHCVVP